MELSQDLIVDVALNVAGYIAAAGLVLTVFSLFKKSHGATVPAPTEAVVTVPAPKVPKPARTAGIGAKMEFLKLSGNSSASAGEPKTETEDKPDSGRRDRSEIIRVAREMLKAGATIDKITSILPISQAELAMLSAGRR